MGYRPQAPPHDLGDGIATPEAAVQMDIGVTLPDHRLRSGAVESLARVDIGSRNGVGQPSAVLVGRGTSGEGP